MIRSDSYFLVKVTESLSRITSYVNLQLLKTIFFFHFLPLPLCQLLVDYINGVGVCFRVSYLILLTFLVCSFINTIPFSLLKLCCSSGGSFSVQGHLDIYNNINMYGIKLST